MIRHLCQKKLLPWYLGLLFLNKIIYEHVKISKKEHLFKEHFLLTENVRKSWRCWEMLDMLEKKLEILGDRMFTYLLQQYFNIWKFYISRR